MVGLAVCCTQVIALLLPGLTAFYQDPGDGKIPAHQKVTRRVAYQIGGSPVDTKQLVGLFEEPCFGLTAFTDLSEAGGVCLVLGIGVVRAMQVGTGQSAELGVNHFVDAREIALPVKASCDTGLVGDYDEQVAGLVESFQCPANAWQDGDFTRIGDKSLLLVQGAVPVQ